MKSIQNNIKQFMVAADQICPDKPTLSTPEVRKLRARLILEEAIEECEALGFRLVFTYEGLATLNGKKVKEEMYTDLTDENLKLFHSSNDPSLTKIADGIADQVYVSVGTAVALGINMEPIWNIVHNANMAKFGPGSWKDEWGKQRKPPGWVAPDEAIAREIIAQSTEK